MKMSFSSWVLVIMAVALVPASLVSQITYAVYPPAELPALVFSFLVIFTRILDRLVK